MIKKIILFTILLYFLILLQGSFLPHFFSYFPNFLLIVICLINLFEKKEEDSGIFLALIGGFFLDVFSSKFFGLYTLSLLLLAFALKIFIKSYLQFNF